MENVANDLVSKAKVLENYADLYMINESILQFREEIDTVFDEINNIEEIHLMDERKRLLSWLSKFCTHIDNPNPKTNFENYEFFKHKMVQQFGWTFEDG